MSEALASPYTALAINLGIDVLLKATIVLAVAGLVNWALRGRSAAVRHAVWSLALGSLLVLPLLSQALPGWSAEPVYVSVAPGPITTWDGGPAYAGARAGATQPSATSIAVAPRDPSSAATGPATQDVPEGGASGAPTAAGILLLAWSLGVIGLLARLGLDTYRVERLTRRATECRWPHVQELKDKFTNAMGIRRRIRIVVSDEVAVPLSWGALMPVIIVPCDAGEWSTERMRVVLTHELAHIRRWDYPVLLVVEVACAVYWLNPLVWLAARLGAVERERACDDQALHGGIRSDVYATHLYEIARAQVVGTAPRGAFAMAQPSSLGRRIRSILAKGMDRAPLTQRRLLSTSLGAVMLAFPLASMEMWGELREGDAAEKPGVVQDSVPVETRDAPRSGVESSEARAPVQESEPAQLSRATRARDAADVRGGEQESDPVARRVRELQDSDPLVRRHAAWALGELESSRGVRPLIERLEDPNAEVRQAAAWALGEIKDHMAIQPLIELLGDEDPLVREMAVLSLGEIEHPSAVSPLAEVLQRHDELVEPGLWALGEIGGARAREVQRALMDRWGLRQPSRNVFTGRLGTDEARRRAGDLSALIAALRDDDPGMRRSAAEWLGLRGDERAVDPLLDALRDREPSVRALAIWALDEINPSRHWRGQGPRPR
ncbi:MAG: hypothetical protein GTO22_14885 [Gemmatimonadales bacterium]|nr:hypothetical protein [Gemmatimonadales bacterium]